MPIGVGSTPSQRPLLNSCTTSGMPTTLWPSVATSASPCATPSVPSVATNGGMPSTATKAPLSRPKAKPTASAAASATGSPPVLTATSASTTLHSVSTAPMDRSSPSVRMMRVIGSASSSRIVDCRAMLTRLSGVRKLPPASANTANSTSSTLAAPPAPPARLSRPIRPGGSVAVTASCIVHSQRQDRLFGHLGTRQFAGHAALAHDIGAIAHGNDLGQLGTDHQHGRAVAHQLVEQREDLGLGPDVDAARGFIEQEQLRIGVEPLADHDLLLVAARQQADALHRAGCGDAQPLDQRAGDRHAPAWREPAAGKTVAQAGEQQVVGHRPYQRQPLGLAAFGNERHPQRARADRAAGLRLAEYLDRPGGHTVGPEDRARDLRAPRADQPGQPDDLAGVNVQRNIDEPAAGMHVA